MRRLGRWTFNGLTVLSLVLCVATVALWVRSHWYYNWMSWDSRHDDDRQTTLTLRDGPGCVFFESERRILSPDATDAFFNAPGFDWFPFASDALGISFDEWADDQTDIKTALGIGFSRFTHDQYWQGTDLAMRFIWPVAFFAFLPAMRGGRRAFIRGRKSRRRRSGRCPTCRYDLTANVSGVCPECGTAVAKVG